MSSTEDLRVAVLISGSGTNLQAIIDQVTAGNLTINIIAVVSDNPDAYGLQRARNHSIETHVIDFKACTDRHDYDNKLEITLGQLNPDLIVLAGYMRILADKTVNKFLGRMVNIHPSLLPAYPGLHTYRRALEAGEQWHGTTVHFVIPELDAGPGILQHRVKIRPNETEPELRARVQEGEYIIYPEVLRWFVAGRLAFNDNQAILDGTALEQPVTTDE